MNLTLDKECAELGMMLTDQKIVVVMPRFSLPSQGNYTALTRALLLFLTWSKYSILLPFHILKAEQRTEKHDYCSGTIQLQAGPVQVEPKLS